MGSFSIWHWLVVLAVVLIFFGAGRLPNVMGDLAKGIKNFKAGLKEGEKPEGTVTASAATPEAGGAPARAIPPANGLDPATPAPGPAAVGPRDEPARG